MTRGLKPLDIVRTPKGGLAIVTEVSEDGGVSIDYLHNSNTGHEKNAWWHPNELLDNGGDGELVLIDNIPRLLSNAMPHPFGKNGKQGDRFFPV